MRPVLLRSASIGLPYSCDALAYHGTICLCGIDTREHPNAISFATDQTKVLGNGEFHNRIVGN